MEIFNIRFLALSGSTDFRIAATATSGMIEGFICIFSKNIDATTGNVLWELVQQNTPDFREKINAYTQQYKTIQPSIQQLKSYFRDLKEHEYFICYPDGLVTEEDRFRGYDYLVSLGYGLDYTKVSEDKEAIFGKLFSRYQLYVYGERM